MAEIVNLRRARKDKARRGKDVIAQANRAAHGVPGAIRDFARKTAERDAQALERHKIEKAAGEPVQEPGASEKP